MINGIDVYRYQPGIDWKKAEAIKDLRFVYAKATQGVNWKDPLYDSHRQGAIDAGKDFGAIHFIDTHNYVRGYEIQFGRQQAESHWRVVEKRPGNLPSCADLETNEGSRWDPLNALSAPRMLKILLHFHIRLEELSGGFGIDYTNGWLTDLMKNFVRGGYWGPRYKTILRLNAQGKTVQVQPAIDHFLTAEELVSYARPSCGVFSKVLIHQYASTLDGRIIGFNGAVDANYFNGTEEEYALFRTGQSVVIPDAAQEDEPVALRQVQVIAADGLKVRSTPYADPSNTNRIGLLRFGERRWINKEDIGWGKLAGEPGWICLQWTRAI